MAGMVDGVKVNIVGVYPRFGVPPNLAVTILIDQAKIVQPEAHLVTDVEFIYIVSGEVQAKNEIDALKGAHIRCGTFSVWVKRDGHVVPLIQGHGWGIELGLGASV